LGILVALISTNAAAIIMKIFPYNKQLALNDCGPACLKMIAMYYGKYYSIQYLRDKCAIAKEGVSFFGIGRASDHIGLKSLSLKCSIKDLIEKVPLPVIAHWNNSHFVVVYKIDINKGMIFVADPAKGFIKYTSCEFAKSWIKEDNGQIGVLMAFEPQVFFVSKEN
jgi:ATP-binding cassette subfamily B protein